MEKRDVIEKWSERVDYDLSAAQALFRSGHFLYVAFLCQQAAEKALKALWCGQKEGLPPFTHNLATLAESMALVLSREQQDLLDRLNRYYIVGRYPSFKQKLAASLNKNTAQELFQRTEAFVQWCRQSIRM